MERELYKEVYREEAERLHEAEVAQTAAMVEGWLHNENMPREDILHCMPTTLLSVTLTSV